MRTLEFKVIGQQLKKKPRCSFSKIVMGTAGYLQCKFHFDKEWDGCKKVASFFVVREGTTVYDEHCLLLDKNDCCEVPKAVCGYPEIYIQVTGAKDKGAYKIVTNKFKVKQEVQ